jgi:hypothetical protein
MPLGRPSRKRDHRLQCEMASLGSPAVQTITRTGASERH